MDNPDDDLASELLIAQLLDEDLQFIRDYKQAEALQFNDALEASAGIADIDVPVEPYDVDFEAPVIDDSEELVWELYAEEAKLALDASIAESLEYAYEPTFFVDQQLAQKLAAEERKIEIDSQMSRKLQAIDDAGEEDIDSFPDVENILSPEVMKGILQPTIMDILQGNLGKGKGKAREIFPDNFRDQPVVTFFTHTPDTPSPYTNCGICLEPFQPTYAPLRASLTANSSNRVQFGLTLPCPCDHGYCVNCLTNYIQSKLDPDGTGQFNLDRNIFPILCPECPSSSWPSGIDDTIAERILDDSSISAWHYQKLLESIPRFYCPNPRCSALLEAPDDPHETQAVCPYCSEIICAQCRVLWHYNITCTEYQSLPDDERSREDMLLLNLAKTKKWRRCPRCAIVVDLAFGCNHITCRCGSEFCFKCGAPWDKKNTKCSANPPCELWDDDRLIDLEAQRGQVVPRAGLNVAPRGGAANLQRQPAQQALGRGLGAVAVQRQPAPQAIGRGAAGLQRRLAQLPGGSAMMPAVQKPPSFLFPPAPGKSIETWLPNIVPNDLRSALALPGAIMPLQVSGLDWMDNPNSFNAQDNLTNTMVRLLMCRYCFQPLGSMARLKNHMLSDHRGKVFACCGQFFGNKFEYDAHKIGRPTGPGQSLRRHVYDYTG